ncbi:unnamed protein product [Linum tenue]|uniref:DNA/RNA-binding protein Alba-like domain-containing protein n=1 Tax=Linum tenue TaxID=586396 RepID=A0AAV0P427_9ROSI|nr:unnamed protein product [Linum tenue]
MAEAMASRCGGGGVGSEELPPAEEDGGEVRGEVYVMTAAAEVGAESDVRQTLLPVSPRFPVSTPASEKKRERSQILLPMEVPAFTVPLTQKDSDSRSSNTKSQAMEKANGAKNLSAAAAVPEVLGDSTAIDTVASTSAGVASATQKKARKKRPQQLIKVSNTKNPFIFYLNLAKRHIKQYNSVELSGLGMAIPTVVTIAQTLKRTGLAVEKNIKISSVESKEAETGRLVQKAKIDILLEKAAVKPDETSTMSTPADTISEAASLRSVSTI